MVKNVITPKNLAEGIGGAVLVLFTTVFSPVLRGRYCRWGVADAEFNRKLPGDELVPRPKIESTRGILIEASPSEIWPWLLQIGLDRGGWYSYDLLEAMVGAGGFVDGRSAKRIIPELQDLKISDKIWMHRRILPLTVSALEFEKSLVFLTRVDLQTNASFQLGDKMPEKYVNSSWTFFIDSSGDRPTRLIIRSRLDYNPSLFNRIIWRFFTDPISFVMERKMLQGIKERAESLVRRQVER